MKNVLIALGMVFTLNSYADIEYIPGEVTTVSQEEINKNRACFKELEVQGCGDPGVDHQQFRSCLNNTFSTLSKDCKKMMSNLYGKK